MTRKITRFLAKKLGGDVLYLGNLNAKRDSAMQKIILKCNGGFGNKKTIRLCDCNHKHIQ